MAFDEDYEGLSDYEKQQHREANKKLARFNELDGYEKVKFWLDNLPESEMIIAIWVIDRHPEFLDEIAQHLFDVVKWSEEKIIEQWEG